jgi:hypothetical protein
MERRTKNPETFWSVAVSGPCYLLELPLVLCLTLELPPGSPDGPWRGET